MKKESSSGATSYSRSSCEALRARSMTVRMRPIGATRSNSRERTPSNPAKTPYTANELL